MLAVRTACCLALAPCLVLTGCLVSFEDYPVGPLGSIDAGSLAMAGAASETGGTGGANSGASTLLLDDFEDGNSQVLLNAGRDGYWFTANDGTGVQSPDPHADALPELLNPPRGMSTRALHTSGSGFSIWGALVGANFVSVGMTAMPYSISPYQGVTFTAKLGRAGVTAKSWLAITNYDTLYGCTTCDDHFGATVTFSDVFQTIQVPFASLKQTGFGKPLLPKFDTDRTYTLQFSWAKAETFDVWIDDVSFY
jgi:hypothetical protein